MQKYHRVELSGKVFYRDFDERTGFYGEEMISENQLVKQLLEDVVLSNIIIDKEIIEYAIATIPNDEQRKMVQQYQTYLEMVVESLE